LHEFTKENLYSLRPSKSQSIVAKARQWPTLKDIAEDVATGISSGLDEAYVYEPKQVRQLKLESTLLKKMAVGGEVDRYSLAPVSGKTILYVTEDIDIDKYPHSRDSLLPYKSRLMKRREAANGKIAWYELNWVGIPKFESAQSRD
jgi:hypothetical protein